MDIPRKPKRPLKFHARVTKSSKKLIIIIPKKYHTYINDREFIGKLVNVTVADIEEEESVY